MLVSEILRIKGHTLFTTTPDGKVLDAVTVMAQHDIGSLVVMDRGRMAGLLTFAEVLKAMSERGGSVGDLRVADICQREPLTATPHLDVMELRRMMLERHARYVPVMEGTTLHAILAPSRKAEAPKKPAALAPAKSSEGTTGQAALPQA